MIPETSLHIKVVLPSLCSRFKQCDLHTRVQSFIQEYERSLSQYLCVIVLLLQC